MKKNIMTLAAVAMLCAGFTSCSNDDEPQIKFEFSFSFGEDIVSTGLKTSLAAGDIIYVAFESQPTGLLKYTFSETARTTETLGTLDRKAIAEAKNKYCGAVLIEGNNRKAISKNDAWELGDGEFVLDTDSEEFTYNSSTRTISATFNMKSYGFAKIVVSGLDSGDWQICGEELLYFDCYRIVGGKMDGPHQIDSPNTGAGKFFRDGYKIGGETCFYVKGGWYGETDGSTIYLKNKSNGKIYKKTLDKWVALCGNKTINIAFDASTWTEVADMANEWETEE